MALLRWWWLLAVAAAVAGEHERHLEVSESTPVGTRIGFIGDGSKDSGPPYLIVPVPGSAVDTDLITDQNTGEIRTRVPLDRETRASYTLVAIPLSGDNVRVVVRVLDDNDNAPTFPSGHMRVEFPENTPRDVKRTLNPARDADLGQYNTQRYAIVSGNVNNAFRLSSHREKDGVLYLDLQINGYLDRETTPAYGLVIEAYDGGVPPLKGTMTVNVTILDVNDNQPMFNQSRYYGIVLENATVSTSILQVFAADVDDGDNGVVEYSINRRQSDKEGFFAIDKRTGVISVNKPLDYEAKEVHELVVVAKDRGDQPLETTAFVTVRVTDVNDNQPDINVIFLSDDATPKISERAQPGEFVARISVHDPDSKEEYSNVNVTLHGGDGHFGLTTQDNIIYLVIVALPLDRESRPNYTLSVVATDTGSPPLHASKTFHLLVTDVNDNRPEFGSSEYWASVSESAEPGTSVVRVAAADKDEGDNAQLTYKMREPPPQWFQVDATTGLIATKAHMDCERDPEPTFVVLAIDNGRPQLTGTTTVHVTIHDLNDNEPIFDQSFYNVDVSEDRPVGTCILKVSASDPDCGVNSMVNFTLSENSGPFSIRSTTGEICLTGPLDFETRRLYEFPVVATDRGGLSTSAVVKVDVLDVNDNWPVFSPSEYNVSVVWSASNQGPIVAVRAKDLDSGPFGIVSYYMISAKGPDSEDSETSFRLDGNTGEIWAAQLRTGVYRLLVAARDGSGYEAAQVARVRIQVLAADSAKSYAVFVRSQYTFTVPEDAAIGTTVGAVTVSSHQSDVEVPESVTYAIHSDEADGYFAIDPVKGTIKTTAALDHESFKTVLLNVKAYSETNKYYGAHTQVNVIIEDRNDNSPRFDSSSVRIAVPENVATASAIYTAHAFDPDSGANGEVHYEIVASAQEPSYFMVDYNRGTISLIHGLDYEAVHRLTVTVVAKDSGVPALSDNMTLLIDVQDVNDNPPVFERPHYAATILESLPVNSQIVQVTALDGDSGNNARVTYKVSSGDGGSLDVHPNTGWVYVKAPLDRETRDTYELTVVAADNGSPGPLATTVVVIVTVADVNDNDPEFDRDHYEFHVEENRPVATVFGTVSATDRDAGDNALVRYSLLPTNSSFNINLYSGELSTKEPLDRETRAWHEVIVEARDQDGGVRGRSKRVKVKVIVTDVNDNAPVIVDPQQDVVAVREQQPPGIEVVTVKATDPDQGNNATLTYSILKGRDSDGNGEFFIDRITGVIRTKVSLDHEEKSMYRLSVAATDNGHPPKQTVRMLRVEVLDLNDNRPTFTSSSLVFQVKEDVPIGSIAGRIACSESAGAASAGRGQVKYTLRHSDVSQQVFDLDRSTGALIVAGRVDREAKSLYEMEVHALDTGTSTNPQSSSVSVRVEVLDVNDNPPKWPADPVTLHVPENAVIGSVVYNFTATDADLDANSELRYSIAQQWPVQAFSLDPLTGMLTLVDQLDFEAVGEYVLAVRATDQATNVSERLYADMTARIIVQDVNDNSPRIVSPTFKKLYVDASTRPGDRLCRVVAVDDDLDDGGRIVYTISAGNEKGVFNIGYDTGVLVLTRPADNVKDHTLNITVADRGTPPRYSYMMLDVTFAAATDRSVQFAQKFYAANVSEDAPVGSFVAKVTANSNDNKISYSIPEGIAENCFHVDKDRGIVTLKSRVDREQTSHYVFPVYATDEIKMITDVVTLEVGILDVNDHSPKFKHESCHSMMVPENQEPAVIRTVAAVDPDWGANGQVVYSITGGNGGNRFYLDPKSGELTAKTLDREVQAKYQLTITAQNRGSTTAGHCNLTVVVEDENDNNPDFEQIKYETVLLEDASIGTKVLTVKAHDVDMGMNARITYSLSNQTENVFQIDNKTGVIYTVGNLDRERQSNYWLQIVARDGGKYNPRSSTALVHVKVLDVNDNSPIFSKYPFTAEILSHVQPGMDILRISATDKDEGSNADVLYSFKDNEAGNRFRMNPNTGVVTASSSLASENGKVFHLEVIATDKGNPSQSSVGLVEIKIGEHFERIPVMRFKNSTYHVTIPENLEVHKDVLEISAYRSDGRKQKVSYRLAPVNNEDGLFYIDEETGVIRVGKSESLDFESHKSGIHLVAIAQTDAPASTFMWGYADVWIYLSDLNDNGPVFAQKEYIATVAEGNSKGTFVMRVSAVDLDEDQNSKLSYHLVDGNHDNAFVIDPTDSGIVKTNIVLDSEIRDSYKLTVIATDEGTPQMTGMATIRVTVIDVNDNRPSFPPQSTISVKEGLEVGSTITTVVANDVDTHPTLTYTWANSVGMTDKKLFALDRYSGRIQLIGDLDYEQTRSYRLEILVSDSKHTAQTELSISVTDDNDNSPVFDRPHYTFTMTENTYGESSMQVNARDLDSGLNGKIKYSLVDDVNGFRIDQQTGMITANRLLFDQKLMKMGFVDLLVKATDQGTPHRSTVIAVRANINDVMHSSVVKFAQNEYRVSIRESIRLGEPFLKLLPGYSVDDSMQFNVVDGDEDDHFDLISPTGELIVKKPLDRESRDIYSLRISDRINTTYVYVHVIVDDSNDNAPRFVSSDYSVTVPENTPVGHSIAKLTAKDLDSPPKSDIFYEITSGNGKDYFNVDRNTGEVFVKTNLDYDVDVTEHSLVIKAQDGGKSPDYPLFSLAVLKIRLEDVNDNAPKFPVSEYLEFVGENEPVGALVFTAKATDADRGYYGQLNYSIASSAAYSGAEDSWKMFKVDSSSGLVTTNAVFDYEARSRYTFTIVASDAAGKTTRVRVKIEIEGKDEFAPQFIERTFKFMINTFDLPVEYIVGHVSATDRDKGPEGRVVYHLTTQNSYFKVNRTTGAIIVKKKIDGNFDATQDISLVVTASSGKQGSLTNVSVVEISFDPLAQPGLNMASSSNGQNTGSSSSVVDWIIGILSVVMLIVLLLGGIMFYFHLKNKQHRNINKPELSGHQRTDNTYVDPGAFDTIPIRGVSNAQVGQFAPPKYDEIPTYRNHSSTNSGAATTSDLSGSEKSGSSGRGSAEDDVEDEEIRMINERQNADNLSEVTARNTQEYLARLGIVDAQAVPPHLPEENRLSSRRRPMENIDMYDEDEAADGDITNMIYAKLSDVGSERGGGGGGGEEDSKSAVYSSGKVPPPQPSMVGSLSSIVHSEEELTGSYNWDYLLDWGPQYQPLAHVFNEIARLKDDANSVKSSNSAASNSKSKKMVPNQSAKSGNAPPPPPPLLTSMAPRALSSRQSTSSSHHHQTPMLLVPRSPISHESNPGFSQSVAMSPSFSPSLSPLANRSPSMSPLHSNASASHPIPRQRHQTTETELRI